jgi:ABC-2 type transport system permease protein
MTVRPARVAAVSGNEWSIVRKYPEVLVLLLVIPLVMIALVSRGLGAVVREFSPDLGAAGADVAVPGLTLMFGFMAIGFLGNGFLGEHGWGTWERLRASSARPAEILLGKVLPYAGLSLGQFAVMLVLGRAFLGMHVRGSVLALVLLVLVVVVFIVAAALVVTAVSSTGQQVSTYANLIAVVLGLLGGVLVPVAALPSWVRFISPITPQYWAMRGFEKVLAGSGSVADIGVELLVLLGAALVLFALAARRFRFDETKRSLV